MKSLLFTFLVLFNCCLFAQILDPYKFFPSSVGNVWEYSTPSGNVSYEIVSTSIDSNNNKFIYFAGGAPSYKMDTSNQVFKYPFDLNWLYYKLDADTGDCWIVDTHHIADTFYAYKLAKVRVIYEGLFYNRYTTFKEITYFKYQPDSVLNEFSWPDVTETLCYGIGLISVFDEGGSGPQKVFQGCIIDGDTIGIITAVEEDIFAPELFELHQNYPNPFNPSTTINYQIPSNSFVTLKVYDVLGNEVSTLVNERKEPGSYNAQFTTSGKQLASGMYFYTLTAGKFTDTKKFILMK